MNLINRNRILEMILDSIDIPASAYEKAECRYRDLAEWFGLKESRCAKFSPHIYIQGSFRLGTVVRPLDEKADYDLDMGCRLRGMSKRSHSQESLKTLVGADLEDYRRARQIHEPKEDKRRCWRLKYADALKFHLDVVPSVPEDDLLKMQIKESVFRAGSAADLAKIVADLTGAVTDKYIKSYGIISSEWKRSNSEGFARWFEARMKLAANLMEKRATSARKLKIDDLPAHEWKSPLQRSVQMLKRHRDISFKNDLDSKPASIIITTLAARAYNGEAEIGDSLINIVDKMELHINAASPRVPNPVDPEEDFADGWSDPSASSLFLEAKFRKWLRQAKADLSKIERETNSAKILSEAREKFNASLDPQKLVLNLISGGQSLLKPAAAVASLSFPDKPLVPQKPAGFANFADP